MPEPSPSQAEYWNSPLTRAWSEHHDVVDRLFEGLTREVIEMAAPRPGERVLDIGCGSGTTVLALAERVGPTGYVLGADIAEPSVARARARIAAAGVTQAEVIHADAGEHDFEPAGFDLLFSRFGVMFFPDPVAAFTRIRRALKPDGRATLLCFRAQSENPWTTAPLDPVRHLVAPPPPPEPGAPGQFAWADPARVRRILEGAGFRDVTLTPRDPPMRLAEPGGAEAAADQAMRFGPAARATADMTEDRRRAVRDGLRDFFAREDRGQGVVLPGAVWVVQARSGLRDTP